MKDLLYGKYFLDFSLRFKSKPLSLHERKKTITYKLVESKVFILFDVIFTLSTLALFIFQNPTHALWARTFLNTWFVISGGLQLKAKGKSELFSPVMGINPNMLANILLPAQECFDYLDNPEGFTNTLLGEESSSSGTANTDGNEELRLIRFLGMMGKIARISAIGKVQSLFKKLKGEDIQEQKTAEVISHGLILTLIFIFILTGTSLPNAPKTQEEIISYFLFFVTLFGGLMAIEFIIKNNIKKLIFNSLSDALIDFEKKVELNPELKSLNDEIKKPIDEMEKIGIVIKFAMEFLRTISQVPDLFREYIFGNFKEGMYPEVLVSMDLIKFTQFKSFVGSENANNFLNNYYLPELVNIAKFDDAGEHVLNIVKPIGDEVFLNGPLIDAEKVFYSVSAAIWEKRKHDQLDNSDFHERVSREFQGVRACIHGGHHVQQVLANCGLGGKTPDVLGKDADSLFRIISLNKKCETSLIVTEIIYDCLSEEARNELFYIDTLTHEGGEKRIDIYSAAIIPFDTKAFKLDLDQISEEHILELEGTLLKQMDAKIVKKILATKRVPEKYIEHIQKSKLIPKRNLNRIQKAGKIPKKYLEEIKEITEEFKMIYRDEMHFDHAKRFLRGICQKKKLLKNGKVLNPIFLPWAKNVLNYLNLMEKYPTEEEWEKYGRRLDCKSGEDDPTRLREVFMETGVLLDSIFGKLGEDDDNYLDSEDFSKIFPHIEFVDFLEGETVIQRGEKENGIYIIRHGTFIVYKKETTKPTNDPKDYLTKLYKGKIFGEMSSAINGHERRNTIQAMEKGMALYINIEGLKQLSNIESKAFVGKSIYQIMEEEMVQIQREDDKLL